MNRYGTDFHVHSSLSWCAGAEMTAEAIAETAGKRGLSVIGLADHLWLDPRRESRPAIARLLGRREALADLGSQVRILLGAEADCAPGRGIAGGAGSAASGIVGNDSAGGAGSAASGIVGNDSAGGAGSAASGIVGNDSARGPGLDKLDFVVAAYHFADVREGATPWPKTPEDLAEILLAGFSAVVRAPVARVAGHPFFIPPSVYRRFPPDLQKSSGAAMEIVARRAGELFRLASARGMAVELNVRALGPYYQRTLLPLFRTAAECGCGFVVSSDAHRLGELGRGGILEDYLSEAGVTDKLLERGDDEAGAGERQSRRQP